MHACKYACMCIYLFISLLLFLFLFLHSIQIHYQTLYVCVCMRVCACFVVCVCVCIMNQDDDDDEEEEEASEEARNTREEVEWGERMLFGNHVTLPIVRRGTHASVCLCPHVCLLTDVDVFACSRVCVCVCALSPSLACFLSQKTHSHT